LIELEDGKKVLAPLLAERPFIGQRVHARMRLSHVTEEKLRVYEVSYEALSEVPAIMEKTFPGYILALTGPSGVGKTTVSRLLVQMFSDVAVNVPIVTTRKEKPGDEGENTISLHVDNNDAWLRLVIKNMTDNDNTIIIDGK